MARRAVNIDLAAALPEADKVEGFLHPRETMELWGHDERARELQGAFDRGQMHHAWLLSGPGGIGKATLAYRFARYALGNASERDGVGALSVQADGATARQVRALAHPGMLVLRRPYDVKAKRFNVRIPVDEVRRVRGFLNHSSGGGAWRVVIVDTADDMNANAANALLKSLEEPPKKTVFLLITDEPGRLLPTIRSRCRTLDMEPLALNPLDHACRSAFIGAGVEIPAEGTWTKLIKLGAGRPGRVLTLASTGGLSVFDDVERVLRRATNPDWSAVHALGDKLAPVSAAQRFELFFDLLLENLAAAIRVGAGGADSAVHGGAVLDCSRNVARWAELWEDIARSKADVAALNLDRKAFLVETATKMHALARG